MTMIRLSSPSGDCVFPKTDYTYSEFSNHRRELSPGVQAAPNMSRVGIGMEARSFGSEHYSYKKTVQSLQISRRDSSGSEFDEVDSLHAGMRHNVSIWKKIVSTLTSFFTSIFTTSTDFLHSIGRRRRGRTYLYGPTYNERRRLWIPFLALFLLLLAWWMWKDGTSDSSIAPSSALNSFQILKEWLWDIVTFPWTLVHSLFSYVWSVGVTASDHTLETVVDILTAPVKLISSILSFLPYLVTTFMSLGEMLVAFVLGNQMGSDIHSYGSGDHVNIRAIVEEAVREREAKLLSRITSLMAEKEVVRERETLLLSQVTRLIAERDEPLQSEIRKALHATEETLRDEFRKELKTHEQHLTKDMEREKIVLLESLKKRAEEEAMIREHEVQVSKWMIEKEAENMARLSKEHVSLQTQLASIQENIETASRTGYQQYSDWAKLDDILLAKVKYLQNDLRRLWRRVGACCGNAPAAAAVSAIQDEVRAEVNRIFSSPEGVSLLGVAVANSTLFDKFRPGSGLNITELHAWVSAAFVGKDDFDKALTNLTHYFYEELDRRNNIMMSATTEEVNAKLSQQQNEVWSRMAQLRTSLSAGQMFEHARSQAEAAFINEGKETDVDELRVRRIVESAIALYDADKTGMADYALESQGGQVISTRCTETYQVKSPTISIFGVPLWYPSNSPRTVIQPGMHPGECWAFVGSQGFLVLQLSHRIKVKGFTYEHISPVLLPTGKMDSAPREFSIYGLHTEVDMDPILLGNYHYLENSTSLQYFAVQRPDAPPLQLIEIEIKSNHGNINYTCLYRIRVHGTIA